MKGLILSCVVFVPLVLSVAAICHILKPRRHAGIFFSAALAWSPVYFVLYLALPDDLGFLAGGWMADRPRLDMAFGYVVYLLNFHSFLDFFYACNGGFSMSLLFELLRSGEKGLTAEEVMARYRTSDGKDKVHGWRLPRLAETGYIRIDGQTHACTLTDKGVAVARFSAFLKRLLNLGIGG